MNSVSKNHVKTSKKIEMYQDQKNIKTKALKTSDKDNFVCKQGDKSCWQRYSSAMGDCV